MAVCVVDAHIHQGLLDMVSNTSSEKGMRKLSPRTFPESMVLLAPRTLNKPVRSHPACSNLLWQEMHNTHRGTGVGNGPQPGMLPVLEDV